MIFLPAHPASYARNFFSGMQSFISASPGCNTHHTNNTIGQQRRTLGHTSRGVHLSVGATLEYVHHLADPFFQ